MSGWAWPESLYVSGCWSMDVYKYTSCLCDVCVCVCVCVCGGDVEMDRAWLTMQ